MKKCFIYCRQSSGSGDAAASLSIQQQLTNCLETARKLGLEVTGVFTDANISGKTYPSGRYFEETAAADKGFQNWFAQQSGTKKFRNGLGSLMERLNEVEFIVVDEITRLHRSAGSSFLEQVLTFEITEHNVKIIQVKGGTLDLKSFDQNLIHILKTKINDEQIANQKRKSVESRRKLRDSGIFCNVKFYGAVYDGNKNFHFEPQQSEVIRYVFESFTAGTAPGKIVKDVNQKFPGRFNQAKCFYYSTLCHILTQPLYAGLMYDSSGNLIRCSNAPSPLVSKEVFFKAGKMIADRQNHSGKTRSAGKRECLIFSGFLRCANCNANLRTVYDRKRILYKCCNGDYDGDPRCRESRILVSGGVADRWGMRNSLMPLLVIAYIKQQKLMGMAENSKGIAAQLRQKEQILRGKIQVAFELFEKDVLDETAYEDSVRSCMRKIRKLRYELQKCENLDTFSSDISMQLSRYRDIINMILSKRNISNADYRELLTECVESISVGKDKICLTTAAGDFSLPRIPRDRRQTRVMPGSLLRKEFVKGKELFEVRFYGGNMLTAGENLLSAAEWENLSITLHLS